MLFDKSTKENKNCGVAAITHKGNRMLQEALSPIATPVKISSQALSLKSDERRTGVSPIPESIDLYLNDAQMEALQTMEYFGWQLAFIRRSDLNNIVPVIQHIQNKEFAVLDGEGDIIRDPNIGLRP